MYGTVHEQQVGTALAQAADCAQSAMHGAIGNAPEDAAPSGMDPASSPARPVAYHADCNVNHPYDGHSEGAMAMRSLADPNSERSGSESSGKDAPASWVGCTSLQYPIPYPQDLMQ